MRFWNNTKTALLLGALMGLCMLVGHLLGGPRGMILGLLFGGVGNIIAYFFSDKIALASMGAKPLPPTELPWLHTLVEQLAERAGIPTPRLYVSPQAAPNAFATGRNPRNSAVAVTEGMLRSFPPDEIEGVIAHELGHVRHRDVLISTIAAVMAGMISYAAYMLMWFGGGNSRDSQNPLGAIGAILAMLFAPIAAALIQMAISRQREYAADSFSGSVTGDPMKLARALQRLEGGNARTPTDVNPSFNSLFIIEPFSGRSVASLFSTHPPTRERIAALLRQAEQNR